jgi:hypothetical protein
MFYPSMKRKVFVSFFGDDEREVLQFTDWAHRSEAMIPKILHDAYNGEIVNSSNPDYVMKVIRRDFIGDSTVTMLLIGACTHSRRYVDWELKATLQQGSDYPPNGLLAVVLPSVAATPVHLPPRFLDNQRTDAAPGYAYFYRPPKNPAELFQWIEDAYNSRTSRAHLIKNGREMMGYNATCQHCGIVHPAS